MPQIEVVEVNGMGISVVEVQNDDGITVVEVQIPGLGGGGGGGGSGDPQTPWLSDIDASGFNLSDLGYISFNEIVTPSPPSANKGILFLRDNGSGVTQLCIRFANGNVLVIGQDT